MTPRKGLRARLRAARLGLFAGFGAALAAFAVTRQRQRQRARWTPLGARPGAPPALLEILAAPGGGLLARENGCLIADRKGGESFRIVDGIPDFIGAQAARPGARLEQIYQCGGFWQDAAEFAERWLFPPGALNELAEQSVARAAGEWHLIVPSHGAQLNISLARMRPEVCFLFVDAHWGLLLEARRRAVRAGLQNTFFVRARPELLPLQTRAIQSVWLQPGLHAYSVSPQLLAELTRVADDGAQLAGAALVAGLSLAARLIQRTLDGRLPPLRSAASLSELFTAAGLRDLRLERRGALLTFAGARSALATNDPRD